MNCLLPLIAGFCLADPSTVALRADAHWQSSANSFLHWDGRPYTGAVGRIELSIQSDEWRGLRFAYFAGHLSFIETSRDSGYEYVGGGIVWRPFGGSR